MPDPSPLSEVLLALRLGWERGQRPMIEHLLAANPHLAGSDEAVLDLIYQEVVLREATGEKPRLADYADRFPRLADALRLQFEVDEALTVEGKEPASTMPSLTTGPNFDALPKLEGVDLLDELGRGAMGVVYRGWQKGARRPVAVKILASEMPAGRAKTEVEAATRLSHPHIVTVHEVKEIGGRIALVLEYVEGGNLAEKLAGKPQPPRDAARFIEQLAWAMAYAHGRGVIHRDLKPSNILLSGGPDAPLSQCQPRIGDFGLAKLVEGSAHLTRTNDVLGTPSYMAPEQAVSANQAGPPADIYALGAILYECMTGRPPFLGQNLLDTLEQVRLRDPVAPSSLQASVPRDLETVCLKCLRKDPAQRYGTARELAEDLRRFLDGEPIHARPVGWPERVWKWAKRRPVAAALVLLSLGLVAALVVGGYVVAGMQRQQRDEAVKLADELQRRLEETREVLYTAQLLRVGAMVDSDPAQGLRMLQSEEACPPELRCFSWGVLHSLCKPYRLAASHVRPITRLVMTPDGRHVASASVDGKIRVWSPSGEKIREWAVPGGRVIALSACDGLLAAATADGKVSLWALPSGEARGEFATGGGPAAGLALAPDGRWVAVNAGKTSGIVVLWDVRSFRVRRALKGDTDPRCGVAVSPDGSRVACAGSDEIVRLWDTNTGRMVVELRGHSSPVRCITFRPDGKRVAAGAVDGSVLLWDTAGGAEVDAIRSGGVGPLASLAFHSGGQMLALAGEGGSDAELPPDVRLWDLVARRGGEPLRAHRGAVGALFTVDGKALITAGADRTVKWWDHPLPRERVELRAGGGLPGTVAMTADGRTLAWVTAPSRPGGPDEVAVFALDAGLFRAGLRGQHRSIRLVALSPDGKSAVTAGGGEDEPAEVLVWDLGTGRTVQVLPGHEGICSAVAISPDGKHLATADMGGVRLWLLEDGKELWRRSGRYSALSFGGGQLATLGAVDARVWRINGEEAHRVEVPGGLSCLAHDGKGTLAAAGDDGLVHLVELKGGTRVALDAGMKEVSHVAFSPDGRTLAVAGSSPAVKLWDVPSRQERAALGPHRGGAVFAAFGPGMLVTASRTGTGRLWHAAP